jgi:hypothetical protein
MNLVRKNATYHSRRDLNASVVLFEPSFLYFAQNTRRMLLPADKTLKNCTKRRKYQKPLSVSMKHRECYCPTSKEIPFCDEACGMLKSETCL